MYDYKQGKKNIRKILNSKTKVEELKNIPSSKNLSYKNGVKTWVGAIFIDIKDSTKLFKSNHEIVARIMRSFTAEIIEILKSESYEEIGIRGDCIYGIYSAASKENLISIFNLSVSINTFMQMFNKILEQNNFNSIAVGIGLGCYRDLIIKVGENGTSDRIWIGEAVVSAANLSSKASRNRINPIAMTPLFYERIIGKLKKENLKYTKWIENKMSNQGKIEYYHCNIIDVEFNKWINGGMKN